MSTEVLNADVTRFQISGMTACKTSSLTGTGILPPQLHCVANQSLPAEMPWPPEPVEGRLLGCCCCYCFPGLAPAIMMFKWQVAIKAFQGHVAHTAHASPAAHVVHAPTIAAHGLSTEAGRSLASPDLLTTARLAAHAAHGLMTKVLCHATHDWGTRDLESLAPSMAKALHIHATASFAHRLGWVAHAHGLAAGPPRRRPSLRCTPPASQSGAASPRRRPSPPSSPPWGRQFLRRLTCPCVCGTATPTTSPRTCSNKFINHAAWKLLLSELPESRNQKAVPGHHRRLKSSQKPRPRSCTPRTAPSRAVS